MVLSALYVLIDVFFLKNYFSISIEFLNRSTYRNYTLVLLLTSECVVRREFYFMIKLYTKHCCRYNFDLPPKLSVACIKT